MKTIPFTEREIELATELNKRGIIWKPKSSDWFIDLNSHRVLYNGDIVQSVSLCLVLDEDGRGFSFLELIIDGEENGNRMKKSMSYSDRDKMSLMNWLPTIKDCIDIIGRTDEYEFHSLSKENDLFKAAVTRISDKKTLSITDKSEIEALYTLILNL